MLPASRLRLPPKKERREICFLFASSSSVYYLPTVAEDVDIERMREELPIASTANYSKTKRLAEMELLQIAEQHPLFCPTILRKGTILGLAPRVRFDLVVIVELAGIEIRRAGV